MSSIHAAASVLVLFLLLLHLSDSRHLDNVHYTETRFLLAKDQNGISGLTSKGPVKVSRFVPDTTVKQRHRRPPLFFADYPKPSTRPPRHN